MLGEMALPDASRVRPWLPAVVMILSLWVTYPVQPESTPQWTFDDAVRQPGVFHDHITYFALMSEADVLADMETGGPISRYAKPIVYFGNTSMYAPLRLLNGYSALGGLPAYQRLFEIGWIGFVAHPDHVVRNYTSPYGLLWLLGVDGLILGRREMQTYAEMVENQGWKCTVKTAYGAVFERNKPRLARVWSPADVQWVRDSDEMLDYLAGSPAELRNVLVADDPARPVRSGLSRANVSDIRENRLSVRCAVSNLKAAAPSLVAFARPYYPGYRAFFNGSELPVRLLNGLQAAVLVPPGSNGQLELLYRPNSLLAGCGLALAGAGKPGISRGHVFHRQKAVGCVLARTMVWRAHEQPPTMPGAGRPLAQGNRCVRARTLPESAPARQP